MELVHDVIYRCWGRTVTVSSTFARKWADVLAIAASEGYITTWSEGGYTNVWRPTAWGLLEVGL